MIQTQESSSPAIVKTENKEHNQKAQLDPKITFTWDIENAGLLPIVLNHNLNSYHPHKPEHLKGDTIYFASVPM